MTARDQAQQALEDRQALTAFCGQPDPAVCAALRARAREDVRRERLGLVAEPVPNVRRDGEPSPPTSHDPAWPFVVAMILTAVLVVVGVLVYGD